MFFILILPSCIDKKLNRNFIERLDKVRRTQVATKKFKIQNENCKEI